MLLQLLFAASLLAAFFAGGVGGIKWAERTGAQRLEARGVGPNLQPALFWICGFAAALAALAAWAPFAR